MLLVCRVAFIPFLTAGDPNLDTTAIAVQKLDAVGADIIELGIPYSVCQKLTGPTLAACNSLCMHDVHTWPSCSLVMITLRISMCPIT